MAGNTKKKHLAFIYFCISLFGKISPDVYNYISSCIWGNVCIQVSIHVVLALAAECCKRMTREKQKVKEQIEAIEKQKYQLEADIR